MWLEMIFILISVTSLDVSARNPGQCSGILYFHFFLNTVIKCVICRDDFGKYIRGTEVKLKIKSLELTKRFLGYDRDITLCEADCVLLGLHK